MNDTTRLPAANEIKMVVLLEDIQYHVFLPLERLDPIMDALEERLEGGATLRGDRLAQMSLRQWVAGQLRDRSRAQKVFDDVGGAACLWLGLRHYEGATDLRNGIDRHAEEGVVLTISIGTAIGSAPDTAWSFMVGREIHDGRRLLSEQPSDRVRIFGTDAAEGWRGRTIHPKT